jgi:hypothetical protein
MAISDEQRTAYGTELAKAEARWTDGDYPPQVSAVAAVTGLDPNILDMHVEGIHGWEWHDVGYVDAVWAAAECEKTGGCADVMARYRPQGRAAVPPAE